MGNRDGLDEQLEAFDRDRSYKTERLLKENDLERTEVVCDARGERYIRKYISVQADRVHPYERLVGVDCPYLQRVHEALRLGDKLAVVCEYVEGLDLRQFVEAFGPMDAQAACRYGRDLCEALMVLHGLEGGPVIHRDVNPGNIIIEEGRAVLIDLGIARTFRDDVRKDTHAWGTSGFAAPEQFGFMQTDARADIYGLGVCLRYMLTGEVDATDVSACDGLGLVLARATRMDPQDRFASAAELEDALEAFAAGEVADVAEDAPAPEEQPLQTAFGGQQQPDSQPPISRSSKDAEEAPSSASRGHDAEMDRHQLAASAKEVDRTTFASRVEARVTGATRRSAVLAALWRIWQVLAFALAVFFVGDCIWNISRADLPALWIGYATMAVLVFAMPLLSSANFLNVNDRMPWLQTYRHFKIVALWIVSASIWIVVFAVMIIAGMPYE